MEENFKELLSAIRLGIEKCPWMKEQKSEKYAFELRDEVEEVIKAMENKDIENLKEELGDLIYDVTNMIVLCEKEGLFEGKEVIKKIIEKLKRRKPYVFGNMKCDNIEEAKRIWNEIKEKEKSNKF